MTDRTNTIFGWILFSGIVVMFLRFLSGLVFHADNPERPEQMGFPIAGVEAEGAGGDGPSFAAVLATADPAAGEQVFAKCMACHTIEQGGAAGIGPNLYGVVGAGIGQHASGFAYSDVLASHGGNWTFENLDEWLKSPRGFANGTKMSFAGLSSVEDRAAVIAYMNSMGSGLPLPEAPAAEPEAAEGEAADAPADVPVESAGATAAEEPAAENTGA
jgi:cytochrome c